MAGWVFRRPPQDNRYYRPLFPTGILNVTIDLTGLEAAATAAVVAPDPQVQVAAQSTATGDGLAPDPQVQVAAQATATGDGVAPDPQVEVTAPAGTATGDAGAPDPQVQVAAQATATGDGVAPVAQIDDTVSPDAAAAQGDAAPNVDPQVSVAAQATATGDAGAPTPQVTVAAQATATAAVVAPQVTAGVEISPAASAATAAVVAPAISADNTVTAAVATAAADAYGTPQVDHTVSAAQAAATGDGATPTLQVSVAAQATGTGDGVAPVPQVQVAPTAAAATASVDAPVVTAVAGGTTVNATVAAATGNTSSYSATIYVAPLEATATAAVVAPTPQVTIAAQATATASAPAPPIVGAIVAVSAPTATATDRWDKQGHIVGAGRQAPTVAATAAGSQFSTIDIDAVPLASAATASAGAHGVYAGVEVPNTVNVVTADAAANAGNWDIGPPFPGDDQAPPTPQVQVAAQATATAAAVAPTSVGPTAAFVYPPSAEAEGNPLEHGPQISVATATAAATGSITAPFVTTDATEVVVTGNTTATATAAGVVPGKNATVSPPGPATATAYSTRLGVGWGPTVAWQAYVFGTDGYGSRRVAQPFLCSANSTTLALSMWMHAIGSPADDVRISIYSDSAGVPNSEIDGSNVNVTGTTSVKYSVTATGTFTKGTKYWLVVERTGAADTSNNYVWRALYGTKIGGDVWHFNEQHDVWQPWNPLPVVSKFEVEYAQHDLSISVPTATAPATASVVAPAITSVATVVATIAAAGAAQGGQAAITTTQSNAIFPQPATATTAGVRPGINYLWYAHGVCATPTATGTSFGTANPSTVSVVGLGVATVGGVGAATATEVTTGTLTATPCENPHGDT